MTHRPLAGKRVVNTRAAHQAAELDALLRERGAEPVSYPCIDILPPEDSSALDEGLRGVAAGEYDWLVLTSENTTLSLAHRAEALGISPAALNKVRVAVVGPKTAQAARALLGIEADLVPDEYVSEALAKSLKAQPISRIFLPQSSLARTVLEEELRSAGFEVTAVDAYRTVIGSGGADVPHLLAKRLVDAVIFTSESTGHYFVDRLDAEGGARADLQAVCLACIGRVTAAALARHGLKPTIMPATYTLEGLLTEMEHYYTTLESEVAP
jgi:uroporphyrinogen-III synthase/uroporphyrinogen III methyltransferase/synthase